MQLCNGEIRQSDKPTRAHGLISVEVELARQFIRTGIKVPDISASCINAPVSVVQTTFLKRKESDRTAVRDVREGDRTVKHHMGVGSAFIGSDQTA